jgi:putative transposase
MREWLPKRGNMRQSRFANEQMESILREADRDSVAAVAKRHGISEQTIYTRRKLFGAWSNWSRRTRG